MKKNTLLLTAATVAVLMVAGTVLADLNDGLVARYSFEGSANDSSGNGLHGTVYGATLTTGARGALDSAYMFDEFMDRIHLPYEVMNNRGNFSVFAVVRFDALLSEPWVGVAVVSAANASQNNEVWLGARFENQLGAIIKGNSQTSDITFPLADWFSVAWLRNQETGGVDVYYNGHLEDSLSLSSGLVDVAPDGLWLGLDQDSVGGGWSPPDQFYGALDEVHFYDRLLEPTEVLELHQLFMPPCALGPQGRLLIPDPMPCYGTPYNEIHSFDLATGERTTFAAFPARPSAMTLGADGLLYVALTTDDIALPSAAEVYQLNRHTGAVVGTLQIPTPPAHNAAGIFRKPNGNLLIYYEAWGTGVGPVQEYGPDGSYVGLWADGVSRGMNFRLSPAGTIVFLCCGHPAYVPNKLVEYDLDGNYIQDVIPLEEGRRMVSAVFVDASTILVWDDDYCLNLYKWTTTPAATYLDDFACPEGWGELARHPLDGSIFATEGEGCIWGWSPTGDPLYEGEPLACYDVSSCLYTGDEIVVIAEDCNQNGIEDRCEIESGLAPDCNGNIIPDACEIAGGAQDCDQDAVPDECESDCDSDGLIDDCDSDDDNDGVADEVDVCPVTPGCEAMPDGRPRLDLNNDCEVNGLDIHLIVEQLLEGCSKCR